MKFVEPGPNSHALPPADRTPWYANHFLYANGWRPGEGSAVRLSHKRLNPYARIKRPGPNTVALILIAAMAVIYLAFRLLLWRRGESIPMEPFMTFEQYRQAQQQQQQQQQQEQMYDQGIPFDDYHQYYQPYP